VPIVPKRNGFKARALDLVSNDFVCTPCRLIFPFSFRACLRAFLSLVQPLSGEHEALYRLPPVFIPGLIFYSYGHGELPTKIAVAWLFRKLAVVAPRLNVAKQ
jgi:hypothetical protein